MALLTFPSTISTTMSNNFGSRTERVYVWQDDVAAVTIQSAVRMFLAKKEWEYLYVQHVQTEVLYLKTVARRRAIQSKKRKFLETKATTLQALVRGHIVRKRYQKSDRCRRSNQEDDTDYPGDSLMDSVRRRMDIRKRIEMLKKQISDVRETKGSGDSDSENNDEVSVRKVERLKARQNKLQIKATTFEAVTKPLQEKFDGLRAEHEKLRKKYRKLQAKNETRRQAQESSAELLEEKTETIDEMNKELNNTLSSEGMDKLTQELTKAMKKVDALVETANSYANIGKNERDASAFADEVARIGREAHRKAKLFGDSLRSHMATNLSKYGSNRKLTGVPDDRSASDTITITRATESSKSGSSLSPKRDVGLSPVMPKRVHGRLLKSLLRDRSHGSLSELSNADRSLSRSLSPTRPRRNESFSLSPRISNSTKTLLRRDISCNTMPPKTTTTTGSNPMRRRHSEIRPLNPELQRRDLGLRRVLSERKMLTTLSNSPPSNRLNSLRKELREEVRNNLRKELLQRDESRQPGRKSRSPTITKKSPKMSKKKEKGAKTGTTKRTKQGSRARNSDETSKRTVDKLPPEFISIVGRKKNGKEQQLDLATSKQQQRRVVSLTAPTIDIRKTKRTYIRKATNLTESAKGRRRLVDMGMEESLGPGGMMPNLE